MASTRLPGKVLADLAGRPVLEHVLRRCLAIAGVDVVVCATVDEPASAPIAAVALDLGIEVFHGSEHDVLGRYAGAARAVGADVILRVTSDCPLIDPRVCADVIRLRAEARAQYAANNFSAGFPHGLDCEVFTRFALDAADRYASLPEEREHVGPWMRAHTKSAALDGPGGEPASWRWTLDHPDDLDFLRALHRFLPSLPAIPAWTDVADAVRAHPDLVRINAALAAR
jgi:spore coat polysaccharide biosynthesis protein SpsF (cytidylyltransferase family)